VNAEGGAVGAARLLLCELGADSLDHPGGTLLAHLDRVHRQLARWNARPALQLAGLCHAFYGTDGFGIALLPVDARGRARLRGVIGYEAESVVHFYASCDRQATYPSIGDPVMRFHDRFSGRTGEPTMRQLGDFAELTVANELDIARVDGAFRGRSGGELLRLFAGLRPLLSAAAWRDCETVLGGEGE
jgi:hypothetical protein